MKKIFIIFVALMITIAFAGCSNLGAENPTSDLPKAEGGDSSPKGITVNEIKFERVSIDDLSEEIRGLIEDSKMERGYKLIDDPSSDYSYLAVFAGQKPSAGYSIEIKEVIDNEGITGVTVAETSPAKGMMVAEVLTYPVDIVKLTGVTDNINLNFVEVDSDVNKDGDSKLSGDPNQSTSMIATANVTNNKKDTLK